MMVRTTGIFFVTLFASILVAVVPSALAADTSSELVSRDLLSHAGLRSDWQIDLPLQKNETLGPLYIDGDYLYILTDKNYMFCIDRKKGTERFQVRLTNPGLPIHRPTFYDGKVIVTVGTKLLVIDPHVGDITERQDMKLVGRSTACSVVRNAENYYVAGSNKRLHAMDAEEYYLKFMVSADNDSLINSVIVDEEDVIFATESGNVVSIPFDSREPNWQSEIATGISAPIVSDSGDLFISSLDMKLYKLNAGNAVPAWERPFQTSQSLTASVRIGKEVVYQYAGDEGLYAVDRQTGKKVWNLKNGFDLLTEQGSRSYILGKPSVLYVMDNEKAKILYSLNVAGVTNYAVNTVDSKMYIAGKKGRLMSVSITDPKFKIEK
jgi:outer membrane protein assembly factor BamB